MSSTVLVSPSRPTRRRQRVDVPRWVTLLAAGLGLLGVLLAVATPFLPVQQSTTTLTWPQQGSLTGVTAPLVSYTPHRLDLALPCAMTTASLAENRVLVSTVPPAAPGAAELGLLARTNQGRLDITLQGQPVLSAALSSLGGPDCVARVSSTATATTTELQGNTRTLAGDLRPQVVGVFSELSGQAPAGLSVTAEVDNRYSSSPTPLKLAAMLFGAMCALGSLVALYRLERVDGRRHIRALPARWWVLHWRDGAVAAVLGIWYLIGGNTSDDGYLLTMARSAQSSGYMGNYFRWFDGAEAPFGWTYELISVMSRVSTSSPWIRLPTLAAGVLCWLLISREVLPRMGRQVRRSPVAGWAAAAVFLLFWLPYDNGLRPEPLIALGALLTWCSLERSIATRRLLPAAVALLVAALSLAAGPTGLICVAVLLAGLKPLVALVRRKVRELGVLAVLAPLVALGLAVLFVVFADQTLMTIIESTRVRTELGPSQQWYLELQRYDALMRNDNADGSLGRRVPVLVMFLSLAASFVVLLRRGRIPGVALGPSRRLLGVTAGSLALLAFTPTKWTHHFGAFAGIGACVAALAVVAVAAPAVHARRNAAVFISALLLALALATTGNNSWWYVSSYGVAWFDKPPQLLGVQLSSVLLGLALLTMAVAVREHLRAQPDSEAPEVRRTRLASSSFAVLCWLVVIAEVLVFAKAVVVRWPAYTVGASNIRALAGDSCALAKDVMVEKDPSRSVLQPIDGSPNALGAVTNVGFTPGGVPVGIDPPPAPSRLPATQIPNRSAATGRDGSDTRTPAPLPFGLDAGVPALGSYAQGAPNPATLTSSWYRLPPRSTASPLLVVTAAGNFAGNGASLELDYGRSTGSGVTQTGSGTLLDPGDAPSWRNLRLPLDQLAPEVDSVRLRAVVSTRDPAAWIALTAPRVPELQSLNAVVGTQPVLMDWLVPLAFPCQRPFQVIDGVAEMPTFRITPDRALTRDNQGWESAGAGGPLGWTGLLTTARTLPTYLANDWNRDWGSLQQLVPIEPNAVPAALTTGSEVVNGWHNPGHS